MTELAAQASARIESLRVQNYRVLRDLKLGSPLSPLTVLLGPNGSGKSTLFDVFAFLSECFTVGLRRAWDRRNRFRELRSRGADGPIVIELKYRERPKTPLITYYLAIGEKKSGSVVAVAELARSVEGPPDPASSLTSGKAKARSLPPSSRKWCPLSGVRGSGGISRLSSRRSCWR